MNANVSSLRDFMTARGKWPPGLRRCVSLQIERLRICRNLNLKRRTMNMIPKTIAVLLLAVAAVPAVAAEMVTPETYIRAEVDVVFAQFQMNAGSDVNRF